METEIYVLGLPNFKDDRIVLESDELKSIVEEISNYLRKRGLLEGEWNAPGGWHVYRLNPEKLYTEKPRNSDNPYIKRCSNFEIQLAELGYYHHRVIVHFIVDKNGFYISRKTEVRFTWLIYDIIKSSEKKIEKLSSSEEAGKEEIGFFIQEKARKKFKRLINRIIDESVEERIDELRFFRKAEKREKLDSISRKK